MTSHIKEWLKGLLLSAAALILYSVALGLYLALMLLVIAMEEGGDNVSELSVPITEAVVLLSQGVGFEIGSVRLTIIPLLLTVLLAGVVRSLALRLGRGWRTYLSGLACWIVLNLLLRQGVTFALTDALWMVVVKCALVFTVGFGLAAVPRSPITERALGWYRGHAGEAVRRAIRIGAMVAAVIVVGYLVAGLVTVIVWAALDWRAIAEVFAMSGMQTGSRVLTTIFCVIWLPNIAIWAVSWLFGGGFAIGELADFTLWVGQSSGLPPVPVFGLFPEPVADDVVRIVLMIAPIAIGLIVGMVVLLAKRGFAIRAGSPGDGVDARSRIATFAFPLLALCMSGVLVSVAFALLFVLSNGSLGHERLAHVGVDVMASVQTVVRPTALGLCLAWVLAVIGAAAVYGVRWLIRRHRDGDAWDMAKDAAGAAGPTDAEAEARGDDADTGDFAAETNVTPPPADGTRDDGPKDRPRRIVGSTGSTDKPATGPRTASSRPTTG